MKIFKTKKMLRAEIADLTEQIRIQSDAMEKQSKELERSKADYLTADATVNRLTKALKEQNDKNGDLTRNLTMSKTVITQRDAEIAELKETNAGLASSVTELKRSNKGLKARVTYLTNQLRKAKAEAEESLA